MIRALPPSFPPGAADGAAPPRARRCGERGELRAPSPPGPSVCSRLVLDPPRAAGRERRGAPEPAGTGGVRPGARSAAAVAASWAPRPQPAELLGRYPACAGLGPVMPRTLEGEANARELCAAVSCTLGTGLGAGDALIQPCRSALLPRVPYPGVNPVTLPVGLPPVARSSGPVSCLPKYLRDREPRNVSRAPKRGDSNKEDKTKSCLEALQCSLAAFRSGAGCILG